MLFRVALLCIFFTTTGGQNTTEDDQNSTMFVTTDGNVTSMVIGNVTSKPTTTLSAAQQAFRDALAQIFASVNELASSSCVNPPGWSPSQDTFAARWDRSCKCMNICLPADFTYENLTNDAAPSLVQQNRTIFSYYSMTIKVGVLSFFGTVLLFGGIGNFLVIFGICRWMDRTNSLNILVLSLAACDTLLISISLPMKALDFARALHASGAFCKIMYYIRDITFVASVGTMSFIAVERYQAICHPLKSKFQLTAGRARRVVIGVWTTALVMAIPTIFATTVFVYDSGLDAYCLAAFEGVLYNQLYFSYFAIILFVMPVALMSVSYLRIGITLKKSTKTALEMQAGAKQSNGQPRGGMADNKDAIRARVRVIYMLLLILATFFCCWGPIIILHEVIMFGGVRMHPQNSLRVYLEALSYANSMLNPYIFILMSTVLKRKLFRCIPGKKTKKEVYKPTSSNSGFSSSMATGSTASVDMKPSNDSKG